MDDISDGTETLQTRVESWECDFNGHWNARFYGRSFQQASETIAYRATGTNPGGRTVSGRLIRYHKELMNGDPVRVRSARVSEGPYQDAIVHALTSGTHLAATAIDLTGSGANLLPAANETVLRFALPRGLDPAEHTGRGRLSDARAAILDLVQFTDLDHLGYITFDNIIRRSGVAIHVLLDDLGFTRAFTAKTGISRMAVEQFVTIGTPCPAGTPLYIHTAPLSLGRRSFSLSQSLQTSAGIEIARIDTSLVSVDLNLRAAVSIPGFIKAFYA